MRNALIAACLGILIAGCASPQHISAVQTTDTSATALDDPPKAPDAEKQKSSADTSVLMKSWSPKFVATGLASGIMVEFTGVKKDKPLHARYAGIELRKYADAPAGEEAAAPGDQPAINGNDLLNVQPVIYNSTINDVKQAFFKVPPGRYVLRQTKDWAARDFISGVIVREGSYSVITIPVRIPGTTQP